MPESRSVLPEPTHRAGDRARGFRIDRVTPLDEVKAVCYEATHEATGAGFIHLHCHDEENLFSIGFATPPPDSTGVAHILEHCVLAGSERFPVKDAFNELGKRSLATFLNAMTWPDRTVYPTCSAVRQDYWNLASVYTDLVFHPLLTEATFRQEGHHLEVGEADDPTASLSVSGVVYNEMKGVYASPEACLERLLQKHLFPGNAYGFDSGGDPDTIATLRFERFRDFYKNGYSPANARFFHYGNVPLDEHLRFLAPKLQGSTGGRADLVVPQPRFSAPQQVEACYPIGDDEPLAQKTYVALAWVTGDTANVEESLALDVLLEAMVGSAAGPVRKALVLSGLGRDAYPTLAYRSDLREGEVRLGLRGTDPEHADAIEALVLEAIRNVVRDGLDADLIEASLHQIEFAGRAIDPPFPIMLLVRVNALWYYGADPRQALCFGALVDGLRARLLREPRLFSDLAQRVLLDNPHRLRIVLRPSRTLASERADRERAQMAAKRAALTPHELSDIATIARDLRRAQEEPERPEALATLPVLAKEDIPRRLRSVPTRHTRISGCDALEHDVFSNGIAYLGLAFDIGDLDDDETALVPFLGRALTGMGAAGADYEATTKRLGKTAGGIGIEPMAGRHARTEATFERLQVDIELLPRNIAAGCDLMRDLLLASDTSDHRRLKDLLHETAMRRRSALIPAGSRFAKLAACASLGPMHHRRELWSGVSQVRTAMRLAANAETGAPDLAARLARLRTKIFTRSRVLVSLAGDPEVLALLHPHAERLIAALPAGEPVSLRTAPAPSDRLDLGFAVPSEVNFCCAVAAVPGLPSKSAPALDLLANVLSNDLIYKEVRVKGGAYGGSCTYMPLDGIVPFVSYRDPHVEETFAAFARVADHLREHGVDDEAIEGSRLGAIGAFDRVLAPAEQLAAARVRHLAGLTEDDRLAFRNGLLEHTAEHVTELAIPHLVAALEAAPRAALGSKERLAQANASLVRPLAITTVE